MSEFIPEIRAYYTLAKLEIQKALTVLLSA